MCTASWIDTADGYTLFFNRDEQRSRAVGRPPRRMTVAGVRLVAPEDAEAGGTWIGVNEHGLTVCLLNRAPEGRRSPSRPISRGLLVASLLDCRSTAEVRTRLDQMALAPYQPFTLVTVEPGHPVILLGWDGLAVTRRQVTQPGLIATSSSIEAEAIRLSRTRLFDSIAYPSPAALQALHRSHLPSAGAHSICMHRSDALTVSACRVDVTSGDVALEYTAGAPCGAAVPVSCRLLRLEAGVTA